MHLEILEWLKGLLDPTNGLQWSILKPPDLLLVAKTDWMRDVLEMVTDEELFRNYMGTDVRSGSHAY